MEAGWRSLAAEQQWLDGELAPHELQRSEIAKAEPSTGRWLPILP
jgi:hypothetical protein